MATKEMERKALEKIRKIVSELGEDSYIGWAFEGCFEMAEQNIDGDMAVSMKQIAERNAKEVEKCRKAADEYKSLMEEGETRIKELERLVFNYGDLIIIDDIVGEAIESEREKAVAAAEIIVENAEQPDCNDFVNAVEMNRKAMRYVDVYKSLKEKVKKMITG